MKVVSSPAFTFLRRAFPVLLGIGLFAVGLYALHHLLKPVDPAAVMAHVKSIPTPVLIAAVGATAIAYAALVGYDILALRFIGRVLPLRIVSLGGFLAYAFGNTIGVSVVSGGAVRYRIYSAFGLNAFEVATVSGYIAVALGTGLTLAGFAALAIHPHVVGGLLPLSAEVIRWGSAAIFAVSVALIGYVSWSNRSLRIWKIELRLPSPRNLAGQAVVTVVDVVAAAFTLWVLMPAGTPDFTSFVAVYAIAMMVGILSHVPGGVGVFEAVVIGTLPNSVPVAEVAAALLMFRMIYYLLPFVLGFVLVSLNELRLAEGAISRLTGRIPAPMRPALEAIHGMVPALTALVSFGFGVYLVMVSLIPSVQGEALEEIPMIAALMREGGTLLLAMIGVTLLILSHGLGRRIKSAFLLMQVALALGVVASLLNDFDIENAALLAAAALLLLPFRRSFYRQADLTDNVFSPNWFVLVFAVLVGAGVFFFFINRTPHSAGDLWSILSQGDGSPRALRAGLLASALLFLFSIAMAIRPKAAAPVQLMDSGIAAQIDAIIAEAQMPAANLALTGDKQFILSEQGGAFLMFRPLGNSWIALGDPVGRPDEVPDLCWTFIDLARRSGALPVFYAVGAERLGLYSEMGFALHRIGEEATVNLAGLHLWDPAFAALREDAAKWQANGASVDVVQAPHAPDLLAEVEAVSTAWLAAGLGRDKHFTVGPFDRDYLNRFPMAVVRLNGRVVAFATIFSASSGQSIGLDLLRFHPDVGAEIMGFLHLSLIERYRDLGARTFSLGMAPPEGLASRSVERLWNRFGSFIYRKSAAFPSFEALRAFLQGFHPQWSARYIAVPPGLSPTRSMTNVALLIAGNSKALLGR